MWSLVEACRLVPTEDFAAMSTPVSFLPGPGDAVCVPSYCDHTVGSAWRCELSHNETVRTGPGPNVLRNARKAPPEMLMPKPIGLARL